jgi:general stress protein 26
VSKKLKTKILEVLKKYPVGSVATIRNGKPWVRYMAMQPEDDLTIYTTSFASARKIDQIKANNNVHIAFGFDAQNWELPYVNVVGKAKILTDLKTKKKCWQEPLGQFFDGPEDPDYVVIKITPTLIEYMNPETFEPEVYKPNR